MPQPDTPSWLARTNQVWKINVALAIFLLDAVLLGLVFWAFNDPQYPLKRILGLDELGTLLLLMLGVALGTYWMFYTIRCPICGKRPVPFFIKTEPHNQWAKKLFDMEECVFCNDEEQGES